MSQVITPAPAHGSKCYENYFTKEYLNNIAGDNTSDGRQEYSIKVFGDNTSDGRQEYSIKVFGDNTKDGRQEAIVNTSDGSRLASDNTNN